MRILTTDHTKHSEENGLFHCNNNRCKLCKLYTVECKTFTLSNGKNGILNVI